MIGFTNEQPVVAICSSPNVPITTVLEFSHLHKVKAYFKSVTSEDTSVKLSIGKSVYKFNVPANVTSCREVREQFVDVGTLAKVKVWSLREMTCTFGLMNFRSTYSWHESCLIR